MSFEHALEPPPLPHTFRGEGFFAPPAAAGGARTSGRLGVRIIGTHRLSDLRRSIDGLSAPVRERFGLDPRRSATRSRRPPLPKSPLGDAVRISRISGPPCSATSTTGAWPLTTTASRNTSGSTPAVARLALRGELRGATPGGAAVLARPRIVIWRRGWDSHHPTLCCKHRT